MHKKAKKMLGDYKIMAEGELFLNFTQRLDVIPVSDS